MDKFMILNKTTEKTLRECLDKMDNQSLVYKPDCDQMNQINLQTLNILGLVASKTGNHIEALSVTNKGKDYFNLKDIQLKNDRRLNIKYQLLVRFACALSGFLVGYFLNLIISFL